MGVSVHFNDTLYLSSKEAGRVSGYTSDYIARLARQGKVEATRVGTQWFVEPKSLEQFLQFAELSKEERKTKLRVERRAERGVDTLASREINPVSTLTATIDQEKKYSRRSHRAHVSAFATVALGFAIAFIFSQGVALKATSARIVAEARITAYGFYQLTTARPSATAMLSAVGVHTTGEQTPTVVSLNHASIVNGGLVILPDSVASATVQYIQDSFSDEVHVALDENGATGVVTPVFRDGEGDPYRFILVPLTSTPP